MPGRCCGPVHWRQRDASQEWSGWLAKTETLSSGFKWVRSWLTKMEYSEDRPSKTPRMSLGRHPYPHPHTCGDTYTHMQKKYTLVMPAPGDWGKRNPSSKQPGCTAGEEQMRTGEGKLKKEKVLEEKPSLQHRGGRKCYYFSLPHNSWVGRGEYSTSLQHSLKRQAKDPHSPNHPLQIDINMRRNFTGASVYLTKSSLTSSII